MKKVLITLMALTAITMNSLAHDVPVTKTQVDKLYTEYLDIQKALAGDKFPEARKEAKELQELATLQAEHSSDKRLDVIKESSGQIASAETVYKARVAFEPLSMALIDLVEKVGTSGDVTIHRMYCPMTFEGRRADWLQTDNKLVNPYFGARMLHCGGKAKTLVE